MARFHYDATDTDGNPASGEMEAEDANRLLARLDEMGLRVTSISPIHQEHDGVGKSRSASEVGSTDLSRYTVRTGQRTHFPAPRREPALSRF